MLKPLLKYQFTATLSVICSGDIEASNNIKLNIFLNHLKPITIFK